MAFEKYMTTPFQVRRYTQSKVNYEVQEAWTLIGSWNGRLDHESTTKLYTSGQQQYTATHRLYCSSDVDVEEADQISVNGKHYQVLKVVDPFSMGHHKEVVLAGNAI